MTSCTCLPRPQHLPRHAASTPSATASRRCPGSWASLPSPRHCGCPVCSLLPRLALSSVTGHAETGRGHFDLRRFNMGAQKGQGRVSLFKKERQAGIMAEMRHDVTSHLSLIVLILHCAGKTAVTKNLLDSNTPHIDTRVTVEQMCSWSYGAMPPPTQPPPSCTRLGLRFVILANIGVKKC